MAQLPSATAADAAAAPVASPLEKVVAVNRSSSNNINKVNRNNNKKYT